MEEMECVEAARFTPTGDMYKLSENEESGLDPKPWPGEDSCLLFCREYFRVRLLEGDMMMLSIEEAGD